VELKVHRKEQGVGEKKSSGQTNLCCDEENQWRTEGDFLLQMLANY